MSFIKEYILIKMSFIRYKATLLYVTYFRCCIGCIVKCLDENIRILQQFKLMNDIWCENWTQSWCKSAWFRIRYTNSFMNYWWFHKYILITLIILCIDIFIDRWIRRQNIITGWQFSCGQTRKWWYLQNRTWAKHNNILYCSLHHPTSQNME